MNPDPTCPTHAYVPTTWSRDIVIVRMLAHTAFMVSGWTDSETRALLGVWSEKIIQYQLNKVNKKRPIYDAIAVKLSEMGYTKTGEQCKMKIKNLLAKYRKVKDSNQ